MTVAERQMTTREPVERIERYSLGDRILHWFVAITFIYLLLTGFSLGYPRMAWLNDILGGGQTVRFLHPIVGVAFTVGVLLMLVLWVRDMTFDSVDRQWFKRVGSYVKSGHTDLDTGRYNAGQKAYYWYAVITGLLLLITGIPLWFPGLIENVNLWARLLHHVLFLLTVAGFIIHVYMSTAMFPGTMQSMTTGGVDRAWAAWHHPRWFREADRSAK